MLRLTLSAAITVLQCVFTSFIGLLHFQLDFILNAVARPALDIFSPLYPSASSEHSTSDTTEQTIGTVDNCIRHNSTGSVGDDVDHRGSSCNNLASEDESIEDDNDMPMMDPFRANEGVCIQFHPLEISVNPRLPSANESNRLRYWRGVQEHHRQLQAQQDVESQWPRVRFRQADQVELLETHIVKSPTSRVEVEEHQEQNPTPIESKAAAYIDFLTFLFCKLLSCCKLPLYIVVCVISILWWCFEAYRLASLETPALMNPCRRSSLSRAVNESEDERWRRLYDIPSNDDRSSTNIFASQDWRCEPEENDLDGGEKPW